VMDRSYSRGGLGGDVMLGAALGPTFSSCSPTYALILAAVLPVSFAEGLLYIVVYAVGLAIALLLIAFLGQAFARRLGWLANPNGVFKRVVGIILILVGVAVIMGLDKQFQSFVLEQGWYDPIQQFEEGITG
jgi:cytochrome c-type biogenesis protein